MPENEITPDELNIGLLMFIPYRAMENRVIEALRERGFHDITTAQMKVAARIGRTGTRLTELADQAQVTKQTAGFLVDQLEKAGFVERVPDPEDGRARLVCIAERGWQGVAIAEAAAAELEAEWTRHLGEQHMAQLRQTLTKLREITDPYA